MLNIQKKLTNSFYAVLSLPSTAMGFALSIQIVVLSWILITKYHLDIHEIGIVWAAGPIAGIVGQVVVGYISDKVWFWGGRRKPFIIIGGVLAGAMLLALPNLDAIMAISGIDKILIIAIIVALTLDLSINISFNPTRSIIADVTPEGVQRTKGFTWMQTISGFFGVLSSVVGALFGNYILIYFGVILVLTFSLIPIFLIEEPRDLNISEKDNPDAPAFKADWTSLLKIYFAHAFSWIGVFTMFVYAVPYIQQYLSPEDSDLTGQIWAIANAVLQSVGFLLPVFVLEPLTEKLGRVRTHILALVFMTIGYALIATTSASAIQLYIYMGIVGIGWAAIVSLPFAIMSEKADKSRMGFFMGIFNLSVVLPQLIVTLILGKVIENAADKTIVFYISTISLAISAVLWLFVKDDKLLEKNG
ncbi:MAG: MFS transporter [Ignavibacteriales bacterium]|nr:MFS transporter [Ignavibacteriales bacterium]